MATKKTKPKYYPVKVYLQPDEDTELINTLQKMSVEYKMSLSAVCRLVLLSGTPNLAKGFSMIVGEGNTVKVLPLKKVTR